MRNFWNRWVCIVIFQFVILGIAYPASLFVEDPDTVMASTDNYTAIFREGSLLHFHNNLTQETYTQNDYRADTWARVEHRRLKPEHLTPKIKRYSPLEIELIYKDSWSDPRDNEVELRLLISIDSQTGDLLVRQRVFSEMGGINAIMWGFSNLSHTVVDVIAPVYGGQILTEESKRYYYPRSWESQLAILQGQRGGVFVRSDDAQYHFKTLEYSTEGDSFSLNFWQIPPVPFEHQKQVTTATWRLNAYQGDWHVPALAYREWMHEALRPVDRTQMPDWVDDIELVITHADPLEKVGVSVIRILYRLVDPEKTLLYVTGWRKPGWRWNYPDYTPTDNFGEFLKEAHNYGFKVMLHTNMVAVAPTNPLYADLAKYQVIDPNTGEKYGGYLDDPNTPPSRSYVWINPASRAFRKMLVDRLKSVWETYNVDAFHLDISHSIHNNALIDGLTMAEGNILLHQELRKAMPGVVLGGEGLNDVTFLYESFAQRGFKSGWIGKPVHPIGSFLFSPYTKLYGHLGFPNPDRDPELFQAYQDGYKVWNVIPTLRLDGVSDLELDRIETHKVLELARERQNYRFGDVNGDGIVNILDLTLISQQIGTLNPSNQRADVNKDGVVNILDLVLVANAF